LQIIRGDRAELQALPYDVPKDPAQADGIVQSEARQTRFRFAHFFAFSPISAGGRHSVILLLQSYPNDEE
jgi:hypothetical protein